MLLHYCRRLAVVTASPAHAKRPGPGSSEKEPASRKPRVCLDRNPFISHALKIVMDLTR